jgi:putative membrane protein
VPHPTTQPSFRRAKEIVGFRDDLAAERTDLANERTLLAYMRTSLAVAAAGATLVHFFESIWLTIIGWTLLPAGGSLLVFGAIRYQRMKNRVRRMQSSRILE